MKEILQNLRSTRKLTTLVENRTFYSAKHSELTIFETHTAAKKISLNFNTPIIASMITGKKNIHLKNMESFDFLPGESIVIPANETMVIDFPEASFTKPTKWLALGIDPKKIKQIVHTFNEQVAIESENNDWELDSSSFHLTNEVEINHLLSRIVHTFTKNNTPLKDVILDLMLQELIVRLLQTKARNSIISTPQNDFENTRLGCVIRHIKQNFTDKKITIESLAHIAHMSTSHFYKQFKNTLGLSPTEYINSERIKFAKKLLISGDNDSISDIAYKAGFNSASYFNRQFKRNEHVIPSQYRKANIIHK